MSWIGWRTRPKFLESAGFYCPQCDKETSFSRVSEQRAFFVVTVPLSRWLPTGKHYFECELCGHQLKGDMVVHSSLAISQLETQTPAEHDSDEDLNVTAECPTCGRENSVTTKVCPRCETRL